MFKRLLAASLTLAGLLLSFAGCRPSREEMPPALTQKEKDLVRDTLSGMQQQVDLVSFSSPAVSGSGPAVYLYDEIAALQKKIVRESYTLEKDGEKARAYGVSMVPAAILKRGTITGLRFLGTPSGFEFPVFIETISRLSTGKPDVSAAGIAALSRLKVPIEIKIFVTPS